MELKTNLATIKAHKPGDWAWERLLKGLLDREVSLRFILENNGLDDALWATRCFPELNTAIKWFSLCCAERVRHLIKDKRSINALNVTRRYLDGTATREELQNAVDAAWVAERAAHDAAIAAWGTERAEYDAAIAEWVASRASALAANNSICQDGDIALCAQIARQESSFGQAQELQAQTEEFLRLIDCFESGVEYTI